MKTSVKGFKLIRITFTSFQQRAPKEAWAVRTKDDKQYIGRVAKIVVRDDYLKWFECWYSEYYMKLGWREIRKYKVANTRTEAVLNLAKMRKLV